MERLMRRNFVQIAALFLSVLLLVLGSGTASAAPAGTGERIIRVGLHYGTGAIEGVNLLNEEGSGFRFAPTALWSWGPPVRRPSPWWKR